MGRRAAVLAAARLSSSPDAKQVDILLLVMWPAVGLLVAGGMTALALRWRVLLKTFKGLSAKRSTGDLPINGCARQRRVGRAARV